MYTHLIKASNWIGTKAKSLTQFFWKKKADVAQGSIKAVATAGGTWQALSACSWQYWAVATQTASGAITALIALLSVFVMAIILPIVASKKNRTRTRRWLGIGILLALIGFGGFGLTYKQHVKKGDLSKWQAQKTEKIVKKEVKKKEYLKACKALYTKLKSVFKLKKK